MRYVVPLLLVLVLTAGCLGDGSEVIRGEASAATVDDDALADAGYDHQRTETRWLNTTLDVDLSGDVELSSSPEVEAQTKVAEYRGTSGEPPAVFSVYATPAVRPVESIDETVNLAMQGDTADLATDAQTLYTDVRNVEHVENRTVTLLGNETTLRVYEASATADGEQVDVVLSVASVEHGGDYVTVVSVSPATARDPETVDSLVGAVSHEK
jgi:hypothetical protein